MERERTLEELFCFKELAYKVLKAVTATLCQKLRNADELISKKQLLLLPPSD